MAPTPIACWDAPRPPGLIGPPVRTSNRSFRPLVARQRARVHDLARHADRAANVNRHFESWCGLTGVRRIRFHHSCASLLYDLGVPLDQIQDILGHGSPVTTKLIYVDVGEDMHRDALDQLGALLEDDQDG
jgi:integrase